MGIKKIEDNKKNQTKKKKKQFDCAQKKERTPSFPQKGKYVAQCETRIAGKQGCDFLPDSSEKVSTTGKG